MDSRQHEIDVEGLEARIAAMPGVVALRAAAEASGSEAYLVGGAVRDALLGATRAELDVVVVGDPLALAGELGEVIRAHERFATVTVATAEGDVDVAAARSESYAHPGALPDVRPAASIEEDLARRDFSVNALAVALGGEEARPIDPHHGIEDLAAGTLRALHRGSLRDDPTRALRAARYGARLELAPEPGTQEQIEAADLATVSEDRVEAELRKLAAEPAARRGFELLAAWGLVALPAGAGEAFDAVRELTAAEPWAGLADPAAATLALARGVPEAVPRLVDADPKTPSEAVALARGRSGLELVLARALGATWLDDYATAHRHVRLAISGADVISAGVEQGPAVGRGLAAALRAKLDGDAVTADQELAVALDAARDTGGA